jgi:hypothetical protein
MRPIKIVGLCLVAAFALGALVASAAQASGAEFGRCVAQKKGEYTTGTCAVKAAKAHKGKFEYVPGPGSSPSFTMTGGPAVREVPEFGGPVECTKSTGSGQITGVKSAEAVITYEGCETGGAKWESAGKPPGDVTTEVLAISLIGHGETGPKGQEPASKGAWSDLAGKSGPWAIYTQEGGIEYEMNGDVVGVTTPTNSASNTSTLTFAKAGPEQNLMTTLHVSGSLIGTAPTFWNQVNTVHFAESDVEVKAP